MNRKSFIYFPSFDAGTTGDSLRKKFKYPDGTSMRFIDKDYHPRYYCPYFLLTAGHCYKTPDYALKYDFEPEVKIMGDSGGYQLSTGQIEWKPDLKKTIFTWLETNSHVAMNLDIPPRNKYDGKFHECLEISKENFRYFADNQTGKTDFLNVLQGIDINSYSNWYKEVQEFTFQGWAVGSARTIPRMLAALSVLVKNKEHLKSNNKWLHILGISKVEDFLLLAQIQKSLDEVGSNITLTCDSSSPSRSVVYGYYYLGFDFKETTFRMIQLPSRDLYQEKKKSGYEYFTRPPAINDIDDIIWKNYSLEEYCQWKPEHYASLAMRNFAVFVDCKRQSEEIVYNGSEFIDQIVSRNLAMVLSSIDEIVKNPDNALHIYSKYLPVYEKLSRTNSGNVGNSDNDFF